jgi:hypothetical protein
VRHPHPRSPTMPAAIPSEVEQQVKQVTARQPTPRSTLCTLPLFRWSPSTALKPRV